MRVLDTSCRSLEGRDHRGKEPLSRETGENPHHPCSLTPRDDVGLAANLLGRRGEGRVGFVSQIAERAAQVQVPVDAALGRDNAAGRLDAPLLDLGSNRVLPLSPSNSGVFRDHRALKKKAFTVRDLEER